MAEYMEYRIVYVTSLGNEICLEMADVESSRYNAGAKIMVANNLYLIFNTNNSGWKQDHWLLSLQKRFLKFSCPFFANTGR